MHQPYRGLLYYSGTCFLALMLFVLFASATLRWNAPRLAENVWFLCGVLAFIFCLGSPGVLWNIQHLIPFMAKFRGTVKVLGYLDLFASVGAGVMVERLLRATRRPAVPAAVLTLLICAVLVYHCWLPQPALSYLHMKPYPALPPAISTQLAVGSRPPQRMLVLFDEMKDTESGAESRFQFRHDLRRVRLRRIRSVDVHDAGIHDRSCIFHSRKHSRLSGIWAALADRQSLYVRCQLHSTPL